MEQHSPMSAENGPDGNAGSQPESSHYADGAAQAEVADFVNEAKAENAAKGFQDHEAEALEAMVNGSTADPEIVDKNVVAARMRDITEVQAVHREAEAATAESAPLPEVSVSADAARAAVEVAARAGEAYTPTEPNPVLEVPAPAESHVPEVSATPAIKPGETSIASEAKPVLPQPLDYPMAAGPEDERLATEKDYPQPNALSKLFKKARNYFKPKGRHAASTTPDQKQ